MALPQQRKVLPHQSHIDLKVFIVLFVSLQRKTFFLITAIILKLFTFTTNIFVFPRWKYFKIQNNQEHDYLLRILFGVSLLLVKNIDEGMDCRQNKIIIIQVEHRI